MIIHVTNMFKICVDIVQII